MVMSPAAQFVLARQLRSAEGTSLGDVFSFVSGLYFRGKLAYARRFAMPPDPADPVAAGGWCVVEEAQRVTRLGEGQAGTGPLAPVPMARTATTVADYVRRAEALGATRVRVTATSAVREATNRAEFVALVESVTGLPLEVLSGEDEARLTLLGVRSGLPDLAGRFVLFDIGGGSTEFVVADEDHLERALSLRLGVVDLAERYGDEGPLRSARWAAMADSKPAPSTAMPRSRKASSVRSRGKPKVS